MGAATAQSASQREAFARCSGDDARAGFGYLHANGNAKLVLNQYTKMPAGIVGAVNQAYVEHGAPCTSAGRQ